MLDWPLSFFLRSADEQLSVNESHLSAGLFHNKMMTGWKSDP